MVESLKTGRNIHRALVVMCAAIIIFGLSPNRTEQYESAIMELETLKSLDEKALMNHVLAAVNSEFTDFDFKSEIYKISEQYRNITISPDVAWNAVAVFPFMFDEFPANASLNEIEDYFVSEHPVYVFRPYQKDWNTGIKKGINSIRHAVERTVARSFKVEAVDMKDPNALDEYIKIRRTSPGKISTWPDSFLNLFITWSSYYGLETEEQGVRGRFVALRPNVFLEWFESQEISHILRQKINDYGLLFPNLRPVWNDIRDLSMDKAIVTLNRKRAESRNSMSLMDFSVDEEIVIYVAPSIILCVISYLLVHILHLRSIADEHAETISEFPWMVLFKGRLARFLTFTSLFLLPLTANGIVIFRTYDGPSALILTGVLLAVISAAVGCFALYRIAALRGQSKSGG